MHTQMGVATSVDGDALESNSRHLNACVKASVLLIHRWQLLGCGNVVLRTTPDQISVPLAKSLF